MITTLAKLILAPLMFFMSMAGYTVLQPGQLENQLGATLPIAGQTYTLSGSGVSGSATSITLSSFTLPQTGYEILDADMSTTFYLTLEPGNRTRQEIVSCTTVTQSASNDTATLSGCSRGLLPITPYTASTTYQFAHAGGSSVIFSNPPQFYNQFLAADNTGTITGQYTFSTSPIVPTVASASTTNAASVAYVNAISIAGAADSADTVKGVTKLSVAAASTTNPIAVGDNDPRVPTANENNALDGTSPSATNKYITFLDATSTLASTSMIVRYGTTGQITATTTPSETTDVTSKAYVDSVVSNYAYGTSSISTSTASVSDLAVVTTNTPKKITIHYWLQGATADGCVIASKGTAVYNSAGTLMYSLPVWDNQCIAADNGALSATIAEAAMGGSTEYLSIAPNAGTAGNGGTAGYKAEMTVVSVSATGFTVRRTTTKGTGSARNTMFKTAYEVIY